MRKLFAVVLAALLLGVGIVALIETDPGYVLVSYGTRTLETSLWVGLLLLALLLLLVYWVIRLVYRLLGGQKSLVNWFGNRKAQRTMRDTTGGLISYIEGNWDKARRQLLRGAQSNDAPLLNYVLAARSSQHLNEPEKVQEYLRHAGEAEPSAATALEIARAEIKLEAGEYSQALTALAEVRNNARRYPQVPGLLRQAYQGLGDWDGMLTLLPELKKNKQFSADELLQLEREIHSRRLAHSASVSGAAEKLQEVWQTLPAPMRKDVDMVNDYVGLLLSAGAHPVAEKITLQALKQQWDSRLVRQFGMVQVSDAVRQLAVAEGWLSTHPQDAQLLLCCGRLAARNKLWGKARDYYESSYRLDHNAETCAELGRLLTALGEPTVAAAYYREGLMLHETALPKLPMPG